MPRFQGSLEGIVASKADASANLAHLRSVRQAALDKAREDYTAGRR
jgi:hypothetical protein